MRRLLLFVLGVMLVKQLAISAFAWSLAVQQLAPELQRKAQLAAASQSRILTGALARGAPFDRLEGVAESFDDMLGENQDIAYVRLKAVDGKVLYRSGAGTEVIEPERFLDSSAAIVLATSNTGPCMSAWTAASLHRAWNSRAVIAFEILLLLVTLNCSGPLRRIVELMTRMAAGDFSRRAAGPAPSLAADLNRIAQPINRTYREVARLAAEPGRRALAAPVLQRLRATYRFAEGGSGRELALERVAVVRILTFLFMGAEMLSRPILPLYAGELAAPGLGLSGPVHAACSNGWVRRPGRWSRARWSPPMGRRTRWCWACSRWQPRCYSCWPGWLAGGLRRAEERSVIRHTEHAARRRVRCTADDASLFRPTITPTIIYPVKWPITPHQGKRWHFRLSTNW